MRPHEDGAAPVLRTGTTPVEQPRTPDQGSQGRLHCNAQSAARRVAASQVVRKPVRDTLSDLTVWLVWSVLTVVGLLALCALVWILAGVPS